MSTVALLLAVTVCNNVKPELSAALAKVVVPVNFKN